MNDFLFDDRHLVSELAEDNILIAGVDEVGRGALFGPVVAAAVTLPLSNLPQLAEIGVRDSKKLSAQKRRELVKPIQAIVSSWHIAQANVAEIDRLNILQASLLAMRRAVLGLKVSPEVCLVDGKFTLRDLPLSQKAVVQGDNKSAAIASASILAKVWRDDLITSLAVDYPNYDLVANKGYPTRKHRLAIEQYGSSPQHRKSFRPCRQ
ncbi:MAG: ribonuclease HII [Xenococcaceae cyanobacterium]